MPSKQGPRLYWRLSNLEHPNADLEQTVKNHLLNHAIRVLLPYDTVDKDLQEELDVQLVTMLPPDEGYQIIRASLADILAQVLNTKVLLQEGANLQALSLADRLESNHAVALTPDGMLHMAVSAEIHARLGIPGVRSPSDEDRYNVSVDLRAKSLQPGEDRYAQVLAKIRACLPQQAFIARLEVGGKMLDIGVPREALTPSYGTEAWMPLESRHRTQPGLLLPPLSRETFEQLGVVVEDLPPPPPPLPRRSDAASYDGETAAAAGPLDTLMRYPDHGGVYAAAAAAAAAALPSGGGRRAPRGLWDMAEASGEDVGMSGPEDGGSGGGDGGGRLGRRRWGRRLPLTPMQDFQLRRAITGLHTWLGLLACEQGHTSCNDLLPDEIMPLQFEELPLPSKEEQERKLLGTMVSRLWKGMISQQQVLVVMQSTAKLVVEGKVPWAAVHVWGFADAPVAWRGFEHGTAWGGAGESGYTVVFMRGGDYCIFRPLGPNDMQM